MEDLERYDVLIVGAGVAGLNCALNIPADRRVLIICKDKPDMSDSYLAQGGICRLRDESDFQSYYDDTMRAGHNLNNPEAVRCMIEHSQEIVDDLIALGVQFARNSDGTLAYTREGGHSAARVCYHEDCTGREITSKLFGEAERRENIILRSEITLLDLIYSGNECLGAVVVDNNSGKILRLLSDCVVLACGGVGGIFENSTNFRVMTGDAIAIALHCGVAVDHLNYIQIHPTTLYSRRGGRRFLISESVRGEGARLLDKNFERFCDELQPRDCVTAAIIKQMREDGRDFVWLDMRPIPREEMERHFPAILTRCREEGYEPTAECVPVVPSQHYFMGGIRSDTHGKTTMQRLYAVGETCCNGVHGSNRLASNSLLESLVFAKRAAADIALNICPIEKGAAEVARALDMQKYSDVEALLRGYKKQVLDAIKAAGEVEGFLFASEGAEN